MGLVGSLPLRLWVHQAGTTGAIKLSVFERSSFSFIFKEHEVFNEQENGNRDFI
jgi:hypothetical protein